MTCVQYCQEVLANQANHENKKSLHYIIYDFRWRQDIFSKIWYLNLVFAFLKKIAEEESEPKKIIKNILPQQDAGLPMDIIYYSGVSTNPDNTLDLDYLTELRVKIFHAAYNILIIIFHWVFSSLLQRVSSCWNRHRSCAQMLETGLHNMGLNLLVKDPVCKLRIVSF